MKFIFLALIFVTTQVYSQDYKPLLDNNNEWQLTACFPGSGCFTDFYYTDGDTLVDGKMHKILDGYHFISRTYLLREEVANKKVYFTKVDGAHIDEYLLYDFAMEVGDVINMYNPITPFPEDGGEFQLDSIVLRPLVDGNDYRHFYLSPTPSNPISSDNAVWVEGAGSLSLVNAPGGHPDINDVGSLSCFYKNTDLFYSNLDSITACKPIFLDIKDVELSLHEVTLINNLAENTAVLQNATNVKSAAIFDLSGKEILSIEVNNKNEITLSLSDYTSGMYILMVKNNNYEKRIFKLLVN